MVNFLIHHNNKHKLLMIVQLKFYNNKINNNKIRQMKFQFFNNQLKN